MGSGRILIQRVKRFRSSDIGIRLSNALLYGSVATILGRGLPVLAMMLTAHILGASEFGKLTLLYGTALAFEVLVTAGLALTCTKFVADLHRQDRARTGRIIDLANYISTTTAAVIGGVIVISAPWLAKDVLAAPDLTDELRWSAVLVSILAFSGVRQGILIGLEAFRSVAAIEMIGGLAILLLVPAGGIMFGMQGAFGGMILGYSLRFVAQYRAISTQLSARGIPRRWAMPLGELPVLWRFSLPAMLNSLLWGPATWCAMAVIAHQPNGHSEVGIFNAANQWFSLLLFVPTVVNQAAFPILTERFNAGEVDAAWKLFAGKVLAMVGILSPMVIAIALLSKYIMGAYGVEYAEKSIILVAVAIAAWLAAPQGPLGNILVAQSRPWSWFSASLVWAATLIIVVTLWREHGAVALAWGFVTAYLARGIFASVCVVRLHTSVKRPHGD